MAMCWLRARRRPTKYPPELRKISGKTDQRRSRTETAVGRRGARPGKPHHYELRKFGEGHGMRVNSEIHPRLRHGLWHQLARRPIARLCRREHCASPGPGRLGRRIGLPGHRLRLPDGAALYPPGAEGR